MSVLNFKRCPLIIQNWLFSKLRNCKYALVWWLSFIVTMIHHVALARNHVVVSILTTPSRHLGIHSIMHCNSSAGISVRPYLCDTSSCHFRSESLLNRNFWRSHLFLSSVGRGFQYDPWTQKSFSRLSSRKREGNDVVKCREFNLEPEDKYEYMFILVKGGMPVCLVCGFSVSMLKKYKLEFSSDWFRTQILSKNLL